MLSVRLVAAKTLTRIDTKRSWWQGPQYLQDDEHNWPENKLPQISEQAKQEVKRRLL